MSRWFRFYADAMRHPKVARLTDAQFRLWVELLSVAADRDGHIPPLEDLKHVLRRRLDHLSRGVDELITASLIDPLEVGYIPHGWSKRQYKSDTSTDRVRKHRGKGNVSETSPETETETETYKVIPPVSPKRRTKHRLPDDFQPQLTGQTKIIVEGWGAGRFEETLEKFKAYHTAKGSTMADWQAALRTWILNDKQWARNNDGKRTPNGGGNGFFNACLD